MPWSERQHALLQEMGIRLWSAPVSEWHPPSETGENEHAGQVDVAAMEELPAEVMSPVIAERATVAMAVRAADDAPVEVLVPKPPARVFTPMVPAPSDRPPVAVGPRPTGVATMDWPALQEAVAECRACSLCQSRRQTVFGVGHPRAEWMIIGEAPGEQEDQQGEPFVGKAGQLLDRMLQALGLSREAVEGADADDAARRVYIANVLKCRPPNNRNPEPQEVAQCEPFLKRQVELVQPKIILAMGRFAVHSILQTQDPIGRLRGRVHRYQGVPVVVTYHPAYLLRNPLDKARSWEDLCLAASVLEG